MSAHAAARPPAMPTQLERRVVVELPESLVQRIEAHWPSLLAHPVVGAIAPRRGATGAVRAALVLALEALDGTAGR